MAVPLLAALHRPDGFVTTALQTGAMTAGPSSPMAPNDYIINLWML